MITIRKSSERGHLNHGWLDTYHTFSFGEYRDKRHMGYRALRVINDDQVDAGMGFGKHGHRDMEIVTYVLSGALRHQDSMGNGDVLRRGDVQRMSAGSGILHSEFNASEAEPVHLLQIWIEPANEGDPPSYEQRHYSDAEKTGKLVKLVAGPESGDAMRMGQDAAIYATILPKDAGVTHPLAAGRGAWVHVAQGEAAINGKPLLAGDAVAIEDEPQIEIVGQGDGGEVLVFDLA